MDALSFSRSLEEHLRVTSIEGVIFRMVFREHFSPASKDLYTNIYKTVAFIFLKEAF
jgi:hypothetical protein